MTSAFRALALDYDGTLTTGGPPSPALLDALRAIREEGFAVILVTGRILEELRAVFPEVDAHFDLLVGENGAVLEGDRRVHELVAPVAPELDSVLRERAVPFRRGRILLATRGKYDQILLEELRRGGLDCQLVRNRGELMVLPAGVSKGSGLRHGLAYLGISPHSALAVGDAENDITLLEACELGVAVGDAVASLKARADVVLSRPNGTGVLGLLQGPLLRGHVRVEPSRWQVSLGRTADGKSVDLPASQIDLLIAGGSRSGKSFAAGLIAEQLVGLGYAVCMFDPEGDHAPLGRLPQVVTLGSRGVLPDPEDLLRVVSQGINSAVVDLSLVGAAERNAYIRHILPMLEQLRIERGVPHWIVIDEAHSSLGADFPVPSVSHKGHCLVTYRPADLAPAVRAEIDFVLLLAGESGIDPDVAAAMDLGTKLDAARFGASPGAWPASGNGSDRLGLGDAVLFRTGADADPQLFTLGARWVEHVRHWHKYLRAELPRERWFYFRNESHDAGVSAANLGEFHRALRRVSHAVLRHHARAGDFSRWLDEVIQDDALSTAFHRIEVRVDDGASEHELARTRRELLAALEQRYGM